MLYFAYGSCMHEKDLARTVKAKRVGIGTLKNYRLAFTRYSAHREGGVADVVKSKGDYVEGVLFQVPDFVALDAREGAPFAYKRKRVRIYLDSSPRYVYAYTYVVSNPSKTEYRPSKYYSDLIIGGAKILSPAYQKLLKQNISKPRFSKRKERRERFTSYPEYDENYWMDLIEMGAW